MAEPEPQVVEPVAPIQAEPEPQVLETPARIQGSTCPGNIHTELNNLPIYATLERNMTTDDQNILFIFIFIFKFFFIILSDTRVFSDKSLLVKGLQSNSKPSSDQPPKAEDQEDGGDHKKGDGGEAELYPAWRKKNAAALHVIQICCWVDAHKQQQQEESGSAQLSSEVKSTSLLADQEQRKSLKFGFSSKGGSSKKSSGATTKKPKVAVASVFNNDSDEEK
ncbi:hypothetical protein FEM48_Zijuj03G0044200 [Ziziphus jujuba var. spinosa]|uniref:Uncharacterized protein n=1 Tax=Ziziphus jujuba var. spinosa TaxID=714518 RepID=A0A978VN62_ZIZJJ|nr:hypothetical protein FEM48_Zijuj03G0044200 [Ziziphus jujuba var. spinosa]